MVRQEKGFTLLEVMLVIVIIGFMVTAMIPNIRGADIEDELTRQARKFSAIFTLASEYSLLNNIELGVYVHENSYQILGFDGVRWTPVPDQASFTNVQLHEPFALSLTLDELEVDDQLIVDSSMFEEMETDEAFEDEEKLIFPQVYILSGGDITPFTLSFSYDDGFDEPMFVDVSGTYTIPLTIHDPEIDERRK